MSQRIYRDDEIKDRLITLEDVMALDPGGMPLMVLANGYTSVFGLMIALVTKGFWTHFMWLRRPDQFASQWWWFTLFHVTHFRKYSLKLWHNPNWTTEEKNILNELIDLRLAQGKWTTHYDVIGVLGEFLHIPWLNSKKDFCSETIHFLSVIDPACAEWLKGCASPTPEEVNTWLKTQPKYRVYGRVQPE